MTHETVLQLKDYDHDLFHRYLKAREQDSLKHEAKVKAVVQRLVDIGAVKVVTPN